MTPADKTTERTNMTKETAGDAPQECAIVEIMGRLRNGEVIWTTAYQTGALIYELRLWSEETTRHD